LHFLRCFSPGFCAVSLVDYLLERKERNVSGD
jgi:hypothetical protein